MTWYRKAKLADKNKNPNEALYLRCMYCQKFLTHPDGIYSDQDKLNMANWKSLEEMDAEELSEREVAINSKDIKDPVGISDGICPSCKEVSDRKLAERIKQRQLERQQGLV